MLLRVHLRQSLVHLLPQLRLVNQHLVSSIHGGTQNKWFIIPNPIEIGDLGISLFRELSFAYNLARVRVTSH